MARQRRSGSDEGGSAFERELDARKRASAAQLLFQAARRLNEHAVRRLSREAGLSGLRPAHTQLFAYIDLEGTRLTELARRIGLSKQAVGQLVDELEAMGALVRLPDPDDRRAKRVAFGGRGRRGLLRGLGVLGEVEADLAREIGERRLRELRRALAAVLGALDRWRDVEPEG